METLFFTPEDIRAYFKSGQLRDEFKRGSAVGVCSVADVLYMTEEHKKSSIQKHENSAKATEVQALN